jgi:hypothetical protein
VTPPTPPEPPGLGEDESIAALLDEAEDIVNAVVDRTRADLDGERASRAQRPGWKRFFRRGCAAPTMTPPTITPPTIARLRDGTPVAAWLLKANPAIWDIGTALAQGTELDWWRLAHGYRAGLVRAGHPCAMWVTRGDPRVAAGLWAVGEVLGDPAEDVGDPGDDLWRDEHARTQLRPRIPVRLEVLGRPVPREVLAAHPATADLEVLRVPRIGNPSAVTPGQWVVLQDLLAD